LGFFHLF
jgi:hypothetical protein